MRISSERRAVGPEEWPGRRGLSPFSCARLGIRLSDAGWSSPVARWAHNPKVAGSNPAPATKDTCSERSSDSGDLLLCSVAPRAWRPDSPVTRSEAPRRPGRAGGPLLPRLWSPLLFFAFVNLEGLQEEERARSQSAAAPFRLALASGFQPLM